jgi:ATP-dependent Clp protease adaptor protein ClpS
MPAPIHETETETDIDLDFPSLWGAKFHNDDFTPMDFVIAVLIQVFNQTEADAMRITMEVHEKGSTIVGAYTRDIAETKVAQATQAAINHGHVLQITAVEI